MELLWNGIKLGLLLSVLTGPIVFALLQTSIEEGFRAGFLVGMGIWVSDLFFISVTYLGVAYVAELTKWDGLEFALGIAGGGILLCVGAGMLLLKPPPVEKLEQKAVRFSSRLSLWLKGFLINTINPFTFFFWIGISGMLVSEKAMQVHQAQLFYGGLMGTIVCTDCAKVGLAKFIRRWLTPAAVLYIRKVAGVVLLVFGVVLLVRAFSA